jgi:hypothetical protein
MGPRKAPVEVNWPFLCKTCTCALLHLILFVPMASNADSRHPSRHRSRLRSAPAVTPQGVTPSSSARNVRRRTTRSSSSSGASNNHLVTPPPPSSIRDTARIPTQGTGQRSNDRYTCEYSHYQSIVASQDGAPASPLRADTYDGVFGPASTTAGNVPATAPVDRVCYCDQPINVNCDDCALDRFCMNHPGFYCSGTCGQWIHCHCAGYVFHPGPDGSENGAYLSAPLGYGDPFIVPLSPTSQGQHHPLLCIKCWEKHKQDKYQQQDHAPLSPSTFSNLRPDAQALRLGVLVDEGVSPRTVRRHITNREELLVRYADGSTLASLRDNSPRPYPTVRPMDKAARATHARYGRVFETSMLCFTLNHCHC